MIRGPAASPASSATRSAWSPAQTTSWSTVRARPGDRPRSRPARRSMPVTVVDSSDLAAGGHDVLGERPAIGGEVGDRRVPASAVRRGRRRAARSRGCPTGSTRRSPGTPLAAAVAPARPAAPARPVDRDDELAALVVGQLALARSTPAAAAARGCTARPSGCRACSRCRRARRRSCGRSGGPPTRSSFSRTTTRVPGRRRVISRPMARPTMPAPTIPKVCSVTPASLPGRVTVAGRESSCDEVDRPGADPRVEMPGGMVARGTSPVGALRNWRRQPGRPEMLFMRTRLRARGARPRRPRPCWSRQPTACTTSVDADVVESERRTPVRPGPRTGGRRSAVGGQTTMPTLAPGWAWRLNRSRIDRHTKLAVSRCGREVDPSGGEVGSHRHEDDRLLGLGSRAGGAVLRLARRGSGWRVSAGPRLTSWQPRGSPQMNSSVPSVHLPKAAILLGTRATATGTPWNWRAGEGRSCESLIPIRRSCASPAVAEPERVA